MCFKGEMLQKLDRTHIVHFSTEVRILELISSLVPRLFPVNEPDRGGKSVMVNSDVRH